MTIDPEPSISCTEMLPILDSIIERGEEECALRLLIFPKIWRNERNTESDFHAFLTRYNDYYLRNRDVSCLKCNDVFPRGGEEMIDISGYEEYGTQDFTCQDRLHETLLYIVVWWEMG